MGKAASRLWNWCSGKATSSADQEATPRQQSKNPNETYIVAPNNTPLDTTEESTDSVFFSANPSPNKTVLAATAQPLEQSTPRPTFIRIN